MSQGHKTSIESIIEAIHGGTANPNSNAPFQAPNATTNDRQSKRNDVLQKVKDHRKAYSSHHTKQAVTDLQDNQAALHIYNKKMATIFSSWPHLSIPNTATNKQSFLPPPPLPPFQTAIPFVVDDKCDPNRADTSAAAAAAAGVASNHPSPTESNHDLHNNNNKKKKLNEANHYYDDSDTDDDDNNNNNKKKTGQSVKRSITVNINAVEYVKKRGGAQNTHYHVIPQNSTMDAAAAPPQPIVLQSYSIPIHHTIPQYKSWIEVRRNVLALEIGQRMFYSVGNDGETVPVSDDEDNDGNNSNDEHGTIRDDRVLNGIQRSKNDYIIKSVVQGLGCSPLVLEPLAEQLGATTVAVQQRALELVPDAFTEKQVPPELQKHFNSWDSKKDSVRAITADFHTGFCRRCYTFGCRIHPGPQVRPTLGPIKAPKRQRRVLLDSSEQPCGEECFKITLPPDELAAVRATASQPRRIDSDEEEEANGGGSYGGAGPDPMEMDNQQQDENNNTDIKGKESKKQPSPPLEAPPPSNPDGPNTNAKVNKGKEPASPSSPPWISAIPKQKPPTHQFLTTQEKQQKQPVPWSDWEDGLIRQGVEIWGRHPCHVATLLGPCSNSSSSNNNNNNNNNSAHSPRTCTEVYKRLVELGLDPAVEDENEKDSKNYNKGRRGNAKPKTKGYSNAIAKERWNRNPHEKLPQYYPCNCEGPCTSQCPCRGDANFCEKYCGCDPKHCGNRFQGCNCKGVRQYYGRCSTKACPCRAAGRECDPDLCRGCKPTLNGTHQPNHQCNNFRLRLGQGKRILMGLSNIQGWGAFIGEPALKGDFVGEYTGELIDHIEADRRGRVYDRDDSSYLFNLNLDWVIDGKPKGNKMRFSNHSEVANCRAEIMMVDGDHRVAIFANRDLEAGEELEYDYHYTEQTAPAWAHGSKGKKKKGEEEEGKGPAKKRQGGGSGGGGGGGRRRRRYDEDNY